MSGLSTTFPRFGEQGALDKYVQCLAFAQTYGDGDADFGEFVLRSIARAGSSASAQIQAWESVVCALPYRRDPPTERLRDPLQTALYGGDCDDLTCCFLAGCVQLGIPCGCELICEDTGDPSSNDAYHIRATVGLPAGNPHTWFEVDPVMWSEREWHGQPDMPGYVVAQAPIPAPEYVSGEGLDLASLFKLSLATFLGGFAAYKVAQWTQR